MKMKQRLIIQKIIKDKILENFNNKCWRCGSCDNLEIHHKDENPINNSLINLVVLCKKCHRPNHSHLKRKIFWVSKDGEKYIDFCLDLLGDDKLKVMVKR